MIGVRFIFADASSHLVERATVTAERVKLRRTQYRPPYSGVWRSAGDARLEPAFFTLSFIVAADQGSMSLASDALRSLVEDCRACVSVESNEGRFNNAGVLSHTRTVIEGGLRLDVRMSSNPGRSDLPAGEIPGNAITANGVPVTAGGVIVTATG